MPSLNIAVIGSGISGLSAAWLLDKNHNVTLFEADHRIGGHTNTVVMDVNGSPVPVDTGFICFNQLAYPNLTALFRYLDVDIHDTSMGFSASLGGGAYEYAGGTYTGIIAQPSNILRPSHWRMVRDILRFFREASAEADTLGDDESLSQYLKRKQYSTEFVDRHLIPMAAAIWSGRPGDMMHYPVRAFVRFFLNHGLLQVDGRPKWGTVNGGSQRYVDALLDDANITIRTGAPVVRILRDPNGVTVKTQNGDEARFDQVVIASHADQALDMLDAPSSAEASLLGSFDYSQNHAVLHRDRRLMPKRKMAWTSWNYVDFSPMGASLETADPDLCLTYWMNSLQNLPTKEDIFVTLNPPSGRSIENVAGHFNYTHPIFDQQALEAQQDLWSLQGINRTWFCGAHFGAGFHEDGIQSGLAVAEQLGGAKRPWKVANESGRIHVHEARAMQEAAE